MTNENAERTVIDGSAPNVNADVCPESGFSDMTVVSLTCTGYLLVQFFDNDNNALALTPGMQIIVGEYGQNCAANPDAASDDRFEIRLCEPGTQVGGTPICEQSLGAGDFTGLVNADVETYQL